jgi:hypothetical protein
MVFVVCPDGDDLGRLDGREQADGADGQSFLFNAEIPEYGPLDRMQGFLLENAVPGSFLVPETVNFHSG